MKAFAFALTALAMTAASVQQASAYAPDAKIPASSAANEYGKYQVRLHQAVAEVKYALSLVDHNVKLAKEKPNVCHSLGMLNTSTVFMADWILKGETTKSRQHAVHAIMPIMAELNTYCDVGSNLANWKPKEKVQASKQITTRTAQITKLIEGMQPVDPIENL